MELNEQILQIVYRHFNYLPAPKNQKPFYAMRGGGAERFSLTRRKAGPYENYELSSPLLISVAHYTSDAMTVSFFDFNAQYMAHELISPQNTSHLHKHNYFELAYLLNGKLDLMIEGQRYRLMPGDACMINSNVRHVEDRTMNHTVLYLGINPAFFERASTQENGNKKAPVLTDFFLRNRRKSQQIDYLNFNAIESFSSSPEHQRFEDLFVLLLEELLHQEIGYQEMTRVYILRIFAVLQNPAAYLCSNTRFQILSNNSIFEQTISYINAHRRKLSRKELEESLNYNGNYISRVFQKQTGQSLADYIRDVCLTEAAGLLLNTDLSVRDICHQIGYENKTVFYGLFKRKYGVTPQKFRERKPIESLETEDNSVRPVFPKK